MYTCRFTCFCSMQGKPFVWQTLSVKDQVFLYLFGNHECTPSWILNICRMAHIHTRSLLYRLSAIFYARWILMEASIYNDTVIKEVVSEFTKLQINIAGHNKIKQSHYCMLHIDGLHTLISKSLMGKFPSIASSNIWRGAGLRGHLLIKLKYFM